MRKVVKITAGEKVAVGCSLLYVLVGLPTCVVLMEVVRVSLVLGFLALELVCMGIWCFRCPIVVVCTWCSRSLVTCFVTWEGRVVLALLLVCVECFSGLSSGNLV